MLIRCIAVAPLALGPIVAAAEVKIAMVSATGPTTAMGLPQKSTGAIVPKRVLVTVRDGKFRLLPE